VTPRDACQVLYQRPGGEAWVFVDQHIAPFVDQPSFAPKTRYGGHLPLDVKFFARVSRSCCGGRGASGPARTILVRSRPTIDPPGVAVPVSWTRLEVFCDGEPWVLEHGQFEVAKSLPDFEDARCGPARIELFGGEFRDVELASMEADSLVGLIRRADQRGKTEYRWTLEGYQPVFVIRNLPEELPSSCLPVSLSG
jgi:hypothetical protein